MTKPQQLPPQMTGQLPPTLVEVELDRLANLIEMMGGARFPDVAAKDVVQPLLYFSRLVANATNIRMQRAAEMAQGDQGMPEMAPAVAEVPEAS